MHLCKILDVSPVDEWSIERYTATSSNDLESDGHVLWVFFAPADKEYRLIYNVLGMLLLITVYLQVYWSFLL